ncbi:CwfJ C-terminus 1-domain-containing protein-like protein [Fennellomyces sp. T-0311]|nr:CwfJ C-terminus 1-domain-containing protein-like protein [Fennellomyces sp. T-0311]
MSNSVKVLVTGSTNGKFADMFGKVKTIHEKYGPFDVHLCTGNFFTPDADESSINQLLNNQIDVPIMTYFITGDQPIPAAVETHLEANDGELCSNLYYLGKKGTQTTANGLKIAFLSGAEDQDVQSLKSTKMPITAPPGVDILLTHLWPSGIENGSKVCQTAPSSGSQSMAHLAAALKPRYYFAAAEATFCEREPYKNVTGFGPPDERPAEHVTRFIGLGDALNDSKQRWFYAFNMEPLSKSPANLATVPPNTTESPFTEEAIAAGKKRPRPEEDAGGNFFWGGQQDPKRQATEKSDVPPEGYVCKICKQPGHYIKHCPENTQAKRPRGGYICKICNEPGHFIQDCPQKNQGAPERRVMTDAEKLESCWFCLANPKLEKHLIASIGNEIYATLAKGPVVSSADKLGVPGGGHVILVPVTHYPTFNKVPVETRVEVVAEIEKYKNALRDLFAEHGQDMLVFELSRQTFYGHAHIQIVPIPKEKSNTIEDIASQAAQEQGFQLVDQLPANPDINYFKLDLPNGKSLVHIIQPRERFNLQFGRLVASKVLGHPEREDWKTCMQTGDEERNDTNAFKEAFKKYDPAS